MVLQLTSFVPFQNGLIVFRSTPETCTGIFLLLRFNFYAPTCMLMFELPFKIMPLRRAVRSVVFCTTWARRGCILMHNREPERKINCPELILDAFAMLFFRALGTRYYIEKYNLEGQVLPHTAIIDPRTGAQLLKVVGYVEPEDLSMALVEFLENNNIDQVREVCCDALLEPARSRTL